MKANYSKFLKILVSPFAIIAQLLLIWLPIFIFFFNLQEAGPKDFLRLVQITLIFILSLMFVLSFQMLKQGITGKIDNSKNLLIGRILSILLSIICFVLATFVIQSILEINQDIKLINNGQNLSSFTVKDIMYFDVKIHNKTYYSLGLNNGRNLSVWFNRIGLRDLPTDTQIEYFPNSEIVNGIKR